MAMNTSGERLKSLLQECHLSAADFAAHRNVTPQHINNWFNRGIPAALLDQIADLLSVHSKWLRTGTGPKYAAPTLSGNITPAPHFSARYAPASETPGHCPLPLTTSHPNDILVPFHELQGDLLRRTDPHHLRLPRAALAQLDIDFNHAAALIMPDSSMAERLQPGSPLAIDRSLTHIIDGQPYAMSHRGLLEIRYIATLPDGGLLLRSQNFIEYPDQLLDVAEVLNGNLKIFGWMFWHATLSTHRPTRDPVPPPRHRNIRGGQRW